MQVLLQDDGGVVAFGRNEHGQCAVPAGSYVGVAAGGFHTVLLRCDGEALAFGRGTAGQCDVPARPEGVHYVAAAAGGSHTILLRDDGEVVACGRAEEGQGAVVYKTETAGLHAMVPRDVGQRGRSR